MHDSDNKSENNESEASEYLSGYGYRTYSLMALVMLENKIDLNSYTRLLAQKLESSKASQNSLQLSDRYYDHAEYLTDGNIS
ncbi:unnamed protein product [Heterobilharzia americana]|nr:unnamed protein product [Heterobilharzia americana]CAH8500478.1 unnamed protein product [Heterobilharzia americana]